MPDLWFKEIKSESVQIKAQGGGLCKHLFGVDRILVRPHGTNNTLICKVNQAEGKKTVSSEICQKNF